jgi:hypothetical protein
LNEKAKEGTPAKRPLDATDPVYLHDLKAFVEGERSWGEWEAWWEASRAAVQRDDLFMTNRIKLLAGLPDLAAIDVLTCLGIDFEHQNGYWATCQVCGEALFKALPGVTTPEEIREFALRSTGPNREEMAKTSWIHPRAYCPNGCTSVRWNFGWRLK